MCVCFNSFFTKAVHTHVEVDLQDVLKILVGPFHPDLSSDLEKFAFTRCPNLCYKSLFYNFDVKCQAISGTDWLSSSSRIEDKFARIALSSKRKSWKRRIRDFYKSLTSVFFKIFVYFKLVQVFSRFRSFSILFQACGNLLWTFYRIFTHPYDKCLNLHCENVKKQLWFYLTLCCENIFYSNLALM